MVKSKISRKPSSLCSIKDDNMMKRLLLLMTMILALGASANSQTIRNANNSLLATINTNGEVIASITPQDAKGVLMIYHFNYIK